MQIDLDRELTDGFAAHLIREKARQLVRRPEFSKSDLADLQQEMKLNLFERLPKFDPAVAHWNVFVTTVVERHVATILEHHAAEKRADEREMIPLSTLVDDGDGNLVPLSQQVGPQHREPLTGGTVRSDEQRTDLKLDCETLLTKLPPELRDLCERLKTRTLSEVARDMGVPRTTLAYKVSKIRGLLEGEGFRDFL